MPWILGFVPKAKLDELQESGSDVVRGAQAIAALAEYTRDAAPHEEFAGVYTELTFDEIAAAAAVR